MPEPIVIIPAVKILSIKEDRTPAEIKESVRLAFDASHQRVCAEAADVLPVLCFDDSPIPDEVWEVIERLADPFGLATSAGKP